MQLGASEGSLGSADGNLACSVAGSQERSRSRPGVIWRRPSAEGGGRGAGLLVLDLQPAPRTVFHRQAAPQSLSGMDFPRSDSVTTTTVP